MPTIDELIKKATQLLNDLLEFYNSRISSVNFKGTERNIFTVILMAKIKNICQYFQKSIEKKKAHCTQYQYDIVVHWRCGKY